jgi:hypothetical protein
MVSDFRAIVEAYVQAGRHENGEQAKTHSIPLAICYRRRVRLVRNHSTILLRPIDKKKAGSNPPDHVHFSSDCDEMRSANH